VIGKILKLTLAFALTLIGIVISGITILGIIDPVGAKMADDSDPFGDPYIPFWQHLIFFAISLMFFVASYFLVKESGSADS
jgi:hypothetical protein